MLLLLVFLLLLLWLLLLLALLLLLQVLLLLALLLLVLLQGLVLELLNLGVSVDLQWQRAPVFFRQPVPAAHSCSSRA
ncbi:hypothetical protein CLOM_g10184 [Closterium sp. NIES-68]|nr:hypothetical protein CLOM_g10184 [Closterium sp. NIES-68]